MVVNVAASVRVCVWHLLPSAGWAQHLMRATVPDSCLAKRAGQCWVSRGCLRAKSSISVFVKCLSTLASSKCWHSCFESTLEEELRAFHTFTVETSDQLNQRPLKQQAMNEVKSLSTHTHTHWLRTYHEMKSVIKQLVASMLPRF